MSVREGAKRRRWAEEILRSADSPLEKVRQLIALGYDEIDADAMVGSLMVSPNAMMYYEQLPYPDYDEDLERR